MIEWLSGWLKEIILVVLLAVFADMLLPNQVMQKYVKVVVSLFILLTILTPIISFLTSDFNYKEIESQLSGKMTDARQDQQDMASQEQINRDAKRIQQHNEQQSISWVETRLAALIKDDLAEQGFTAVSKVEASIEMDEAGRADVTELRVFKLQEDGNKAGRQGMNSAFIEPIKPIEPIEPVDIEIGIDAGSTSIRKHNAEEIDRNEQESAIETNKQIRDHITKQWQIPAERIRIQVIS